MSNLTIQPLSDFNLGSGTYGSVDLVNIIDRASNITYLAARKRFNTVESFLFEKDLNKAISDKIQKNNLQRLCKLILYDKPKLDLFIEFIPGRNAYEFARSCLDANGYYSANLMYHILHEVCLATNEMHSIDLIHYDIKIDNVIFNGDNRAVLIDYSLAQFTNSRIKGYGSEITYYMAPETQHDHTITSKLDIFSIAVLMYDLYHGSVASVYGDHNNVNRFVVNNHIRGIMRGNSEADETKIKLIENFISQGLSRDANLRPNLSTILESKQKKSYNMTSSFISSLCQKMSKAFSIFNDEITSLRGKVNSQNKKILKLDENVQMISSKLDNSTRENILLKQKVESLENELAELKLSKEIKITIMESSHETPGSDVMMESVEASNEPLETGESTEPYEEIKTNDQ